MGFSTLAGAGDCRCFGFCTFEVFVVADGTAAEPTKQCTDGGTFTCVVGLVADYCPTEGSYCGSAKSVAGCTWPVLSQPVMARRLSAAREERIFVCFMS